MRILLKFPTRSRPQQAMRVIQQYSNMAINPKSIGVAMSCDSDDDSMTRTLVKDEFDRILGQFGWHQIYYGNSKTKIEACNADMEKIEYAWDIVVLVSDDMVPIVRGYDDVIRSHMIASFPNTDGILWFNDGHQEDKLNTLSVMGRTMYQSFGYIYHPSYKSFYCDTEFTDLCKTTLKSKCLYSPTCIVRHEHPGNGYGGFDSLYQKNQLAWTHDMDNYINRKQYPVDWTIMIPTIPGRERKLQSLIQSIHELRQRICPALHIAIAVGFDNREVSIGTKRQNMLQAAEGRYTSFVDDDDTVTAHYFEDAAACIAGNFDCMRLRGQISQWTFTHSLANKLTDPMANETTFLRPPNHLNVMKADIAKTIRFRDATSGEDLDWTIRLARTGFLRTEYRSDESRIHYIYDIGDRQMGESTLTYQRTVTYENQLKNVLVTTNTERPVARPAATQLRLGPRGFMRT
jgi:hypothetical protein